ncbi:hypothetical protein U1Q18_040426 [Sarracenia purpurea var. burkii]
MTGPIRGYIVNVLLMPSAWKRRPEKRSERPEKRRHERRNSGAGDGERKPGDPLRLTDVSRKINVNLTRSVDPERHDGPDPGLHRQRIADAVRLETEARETK